MRLSTQASGNWPGTSLPPLLLSTKPDTVRAERRLRDVVGVNTFRCIRRSFHVVSRRFASSNSAFPQVKPISAPSSIPGSSTRGPQVRAVFMACVCADQPIRSTIAAPLPGSIEIPLPEIGCKNLVHIHVGTAQRDTRVGRGDDHILIKHGRGLTFTVRPRLGLPGPPVSCSG